MLLVKAGDLGPADLMRALKSADGDEVRLRDILRLEGLVGERSLTQALATQYRTTAMDPDLTPPDPRLFDRLDASEWLRRGYLPWCRIGGATLIATTRPEAFAAEKEGLQQLFGPLAMALVSERDLHRAIAEIRGGSLKQSAETCVAARESCRTWKASRFGLGLWSLIAAGLLATALAPLAVFLTLLAIVGLALLAGTLLKIVAAATMLRARARPRPTPPLPGRERPVISILVPLYREPDIAPRLVARLGALTWPREKLDVLLAIEENDHLTRNALRRARLPAWMRVIVVPDSKLKTKPRAMNYALDFAQGSIVGVYDAEDAPAHDQLHRIAARFAEAGPDLACIQGVLDYYNPRTNWIARCFTIEYASWFRLMLPGFQRLGLAVPLGGTTLFFRREILEKLGCWDAHNVTEDADLGIRLARHGYRTELMETVTLEEANCGIVPWIKQRSRWLKGYAMTYAVHMRDPVLLWQQFGWRKFLGFQLVFLGMLIQFLFAPVLWTFWLLLVGFGHPLSAVVPVLALTGLFLVAELTSLTVNLCALHARDHRGLRPWVLMMPLYFPLATFAAWKGLFEMGARPFYWDKTTHGLHDSALQPALAGGQGS
ncbi:glycosyltransferase family 2 protein [Pararhodobacter sp. SW119]|uniref:glycosyltransferase family 2 protein n=1 Tax=Pararhodobacter sp. SW119 TaxID=2780075 RepID=UPI001ADFACEB|nr:glycosyltransferase family 2 protein [Pararhodobacter sp. SW119]